MRPSAVFHRLLTWQHLNASGLVRSLVNMTHWRTGAAAGKFGAELPTERALKGDVEPTGLLSEWWRRVDAKRGAHVSGALAHGMPPQHSARGMAPPACSRHTRSATRPSAGDRTSSARSRSGTVARIGGSARCDRVTRLPSHHPAQYWLLHTNKPVHPRHTVRYRHAPAGRVGRPVRITAHSSFEASRRSAHADECRRVTVLVALFNVTKLDGRTCRITTKLFALSRPNSGQTLLSYLPLHETAPKQSVSVEDNGSEERWGQSRSQGRGAQGCCTQGHAVHCEWRRLT